MNEPTKVDIVITGITLSGYIVRSPEATPQPAPAPQPAPSPVRYTYEQWEQAKEQPEYQPPAPKFGGKYARWTPQEDEVVRQAYSPENKSPTGKVRHKFLRKAARTLHRTPIGVRRRARELGLTQQSTIAPNKRKASNSVLPFPGNGEGSRWSKDEEAYLRHMYATNLDKNGELRQGIMKHICKVLRRKESGVYQRIVKLGLRRGKR